LTELRIRQVVATVVVEEKKKKKKKKKKHQKRIACKTSLIFSIESNSDRIAIAHSCAVSDPKFDLKGGATHEVNITE
jgi:hypothetical protein